MIDEWASPYNPFNPIKILLWRQHLEGCSRDDYLPPIMVNSYLTNQCLHQCVWCINWGWRKKSPASMPEGHALKLADFYKEWNIHSTCLGGGESTLHPDLVPFLYRLKENGIRVGIATNGGSHLTEEKLRAMAECADWIGFSIDAGDASTHSMIHGVDKDEFDKVLDNMARLTCGGADVTYKMLIHPAMVHTIFRAARIAKSLGAKAIMMRPVGWVNIERTKGQPPLDFKPVLDDLRWQVEGARTLEDGDFKVYCVLQKFGEGLETKVKFSRCWAAPLTITAGADGFWYNCCDVMDRDWNKMCHHFPDPSEILKFWNSQEHKKLVRAIDPHQCPRCTFSSYGEIVEKVIIEDRMMMDFP
jgi:MoaA/NifB/PqqE/SkfB family radical SAM enzyme